MCRMDNAKGRDMRSREPFTRPEILKDLAKKLRIDVLMMTQRARSSHIGSNFSMIEILSVLYSCVMDFDPSNPEWPDRDRFVLSKGHACAALYAVLAEKGFFPRSWLDTFYLDGSQLAGHATRNGVPGIEVSTGSLGHGLSMAVGMALAAKRSDENHRVFCLLSDGECDEGSTWEAILFATQHRLDNLVAVVDYNKIQSMGRIEEVLELEPFAEKWRSFGWSVKEIDGHDFESLLDAFQELPLESGKPSCVLAHTIKGKGVSFMENSLLWHYRSPQGEEYLDALRELEAGR